MKSFNPSELHKMKKNVMQYFSMHVRTYVKIDKFILSYSIRHSMNKAQFVELMESFTDKLVLQAKSNDMKHNAWFMFMSDERSSIKVTWKTNKIIDVQAIRCPRDIKYYNSPKYYMECIMNDNDRIYGIERFDVLCDTITLEKRNKEYLTILMKVGDMKVSEDIVKTKSVYIDKYIEFINKIENTWYIDSIYYCGRKVTFDFDDEGLYCIIITGEYYFEHTCDYLELFERDKNGDLIIVSKDKNGIPTRTLRLTTNNEDEDD